MLYWCMICMDVMLWKQNDSKGWTIWSEVGEAKLRMILACPEEGTVNK